METRGTAVPSAVLVTCRGCGGEITGQRCMTVFGPMHPACSVGAAADALCVVCLQPLGVEVLPYNCGGGVEHPACHEYHHVGVRPATSDVADVVTGIRTAAGELWQAARAYEDAVSDEANALIALVEATDSARPDRVAAAREVLTAVLRRRDAAAERLGVAGPDALTVQLLGLLAAGRLVLLPAGAGSCDARGEVT